MFQDFLHQFLFGWFPYIAVTVLILGSILRFDAAQYSWRSESSQFLRRKQMMLGSNLFHLGMLVLLVGHLFGLMTPIWLIDAVGITHEFKQITAITVGGIAGVAGLVGASLLLHRRLFEPRIRFTSSIGDITVLTLLWVQLILGVGTVWWSVQDLDGAEMVRLMSWAHGLSVFNPDAPGWLVGAPLIFKLHIVLGLIIIFISPFTRLVHVWSAPIWFLFRPGYQIVRSRHTIGKSRNIPPARVAMTGTSGTGKSRQIAESGE
ncbi:respiratory nitrate reductase subunit gamma [Mesorhizobium sp. A623]